MKESKKQPRAAARAMMPAREPEPPAPVLPVCAPPTTRTTPQFKFVFRRPILLQKIATLQDLQIACVGVLDCSVYIGLDVRFEQTWDLMELAIGDLSSTMSLAPGEALTLEFQHTQRKVLDRDVVDSVESINSSESQTSDKEAVNVTRASTKTENWHIDGDGGVHIGDVVNFNIGGGYSASITQSNQQAIDHVTETTQKSSQSLKALHKIEVRGVSEEVITNRMTRVINNPYPDRTMSMNVFQVLKHYSISTAPKESWAVLAVRINQLSFDSDFVVAYTDFLRTNLLDSSLIDDLATAVQGVKPLFLLDAEGTAGAIARQALSLLFDDPGGRVSMFDVPPEPATGLNANISSNSFDAYINKSDLVWDHSGLKAALDNGLEQIFTTLSFYRILYFMSATLVGGVVQIDDDVAVRIVVTLAAAVGPQWDTITKSLSALMDKDHFGEAVRRLSGFLAMVRGMLTPLIDPSNQEKTDLQAHAKAIYVLNRLLKHLSCNQNYYIQQFLRYIAAKTENQAIIDFLRNVLADAAVNAALAPVTVFQPDADRLFTAAQEIFLPGLEPLSAGDIVQLGKELGLTGDTTPPIDPNPKTVEVDVPTDGIHLEVAEGACVLQNVPCQPANLALSVQGLNVTFTGKCGDQRENDGRSDS